MRQKRPNKDDPMIRQTAVLAGIFLILFTTPALAARLCFYHERTSETTGIFRQGPVCSENRHASNELNLGDDTGWRNQRLAFSYQGAGRVCIRFRARGSAGWTETPWRCSQDGQMSPWLQLGDDTGWRDQHLQILSSSSEPVCFHHSRTGSSGRSRTGYVCSANNQPSRWA